MNAQAVNDNQNITKAYVDQFHQENGQPRQNLGIDFKAESSDLVNNNKDNGFNDKKLTNIDSTTVIINPTSENEVTHKKYVNDTIEEVSILRFNQTLETQLKVSVGNDTYNLTKHN